jgi:multiple sugar transport system substrate-binding protein
MTTNTTLSIPNALKAARPEDYYENTVTIGWPSSADRGLLTVYAGLQEAVAFSAGGHEALTREFVRFLVGGGWLGHWLDFTGDRYLPPMPALIDQPFWLDPSDPHHMASAIQFLTRPRTYDYAVVSGEWRHARVRTERVWPKAVHRVAADGLSPEQAVDEAVARIKQLLSE